MTAPLILGCWLGAGLLAAWWYRARAERAREVEWMVGQIMAHVRLRDVLERSRFRLHAWRNN